MRKWLVAVVALLATACTSAISGSGELVPGAGGEQTTNGAPSETPTGPPSSSSKPSPPPNPLACPHISYAAGRLAFDCVSSHLVRTPGDPVWQLTLSQLVEPTWSLAEGARTLQPLRGAGLKQVALANRTAMLANAEYGDGPTVRTVSARPATVAGVPAFIVQSTITINPDYRAANGLAVHVEKLWIVTLNAGDGNVAAWYVSIPDDVAQLWSSVPGLIASIGLI